VSLEALLESGAIKNAKDGLKILGDGEVTKPFNVKAHKFSASAKEKIEKAGGKVEQIVVVAKITPQQRKAEEKKAAKDSKKPAAKA
jgi:large subunit ribosomal protein L15